MEQEMDMSPLLPLQPQLCGRLSLYDDSLQLQAQKKSGVSASVVSYRRLVIPSRSK
jgi:hypothetical protein